MWKVSKGGRTYRSGKALSEDVRISIIDKILQRGGNVVTGVFPGKYTEIARELNISSAVVSNIWSQYYQNNSLSLKKRQGGINTSLSNGDLHLIEILKRQKPSITNSEIVEMLDIYFRRKPHGTSKITKRPKLFFEKNYSGCSRKIYYYRIWHILSCSSITCSPKIYTC